MTPDEAPPTIENRFLSEMQQIRRVMVAGTLLAFCVLFIQITAIFLIWVAFRGPIRQLDELTRMNQAIITATCDSTLFTPDELLRRTPMQKRRLALVCGSRHRLDSLMRTSPRDTTRVP
jgi:hypothetical protein